MPQPTPLCELLQSTRIRRQEVPVFLQEKDIQELRAKDGLSFMDARKKFLAPQPTIETQSFATAVRRPRGIDAATQTTALVNRGIG
jgi:hypothetical protein